MRSVDKMLEDNPMRYNLHVRAREPFIRDALQAVSNREGRLLDVGCGIGYFSSVISECGNSVVALDIDFQSVSTVSNMVVTQTEQNGDIRCVVGNGAELPFKDGSFDVVLASETIEHVENDDEMLAGIWRILKSEGMLILTTVCLDGLLPVSDFMHKDGHEKHYKIGYKKDEIVNLLIRNGFVTDSIQYAFFGLSRLIMELSKMGYRVKGGKYQSQNDIFKVTDSLFFRIYKFFFPALLYINKLDSFLARYFKGDIIIMTARRQ